MEGDRRAREGCPTSPTTLFGQALGQAFGQAFAWPRPRPPATLQVSAPSQGYLKPCPDSALQCPIIARLK